MKRFLFFCVCSLIPVLLYPQVQKGSRMPGVSAGMQIQFDKYETRKNMTLNLSAHPSMIWFISDGLGVGGSLGGSFSGGNSKLSSTSLTYLSNNIYLSLGPSIIYYLGDSNTGMTFVQADIGIGMGRTSARSKSSSGLGEPSISWPLFWNTSLGVGYEYFIREYLGLYGSLTAGFNQDITFYAESDSDPNKTSHLNTRIGLGIRWHLLPKGGK